MKNVCKWNKPNMVKCLVYHSVQWNAHQVQLCWRSTRQNDVRWYDAICSRRYILSNILFILISCHFQPGVTTQIKAHNWKELHEKIWNITVDIKSQFAFASLVFSTQAECSISWTICVMSSATTNEAQTNPRNFFTFQRRQKDYNWKKIHVAVLQQKHCLISVNNTACCRYRSNNLFCDAKSLSKHNK